MTTGELYIYDKDDADLDDDKSDGVLLPTVIIDDEPGTIVLTPVPPVLWRSSYKKVFALETYT